jgi:RNA polymerase-binding transcription factor DksA
MMSQLDNADSNDVADTSPTYKAVEDGTVNQSKEEIIDMAQRQQKFIKGLEAALVRIQNKTYGIDRITGKLIPKGSPAGGSSCYPQCRFQREE